MWLWLKMQVAHFMVWIGIDWPNMPDGDKLNAVVGVGIGLIGAYIGRQANRLAKRQAEIAEIQHHRLQRQLTRKPNLFVTSEISKDEQGTFHSLLLKNTGNKSTRQVSVIIMYPESTDAFFKFETHSWAVRTVEMREWGRTVIFSQTLKETAFVEKPIAIARVRNLSDLHKPLVWFRWKLSCEDGEFPANETQDAEVLGLLLL